MKEKDIISAMEFIDEKYIEESENFSKKRKKSVISFPPGMTKCTMKTTVAHTLLRQ